MSTAAAPPLFTSAACCHWGKPLGNTAVLYRCSPRARLWPWVCIIGPHWLAVPAVLGLMLLVGVVFMTLM